MSTVISFLEMVGKDADLRFLTSEQLELAMPETCRVRAGVLGNLEGLKTLVGATKIVFCGVMRPDEEEEEEEPGQEDDEVRLAGAA